LNFDNKFHLFYQQEISEATDFAARKYKVDTPRQSQSDIGVTVAMKEASTAKVLSYKGQFSKYTSVANPNLGAQFLDEV